MNPGFIVVDAPTTDVTEVLRAAMDQAAREGKAVMCTGGEITGPIELKASLHAIDSKVSKFVSRVVDGPTFYAEGTVQYLVLSGFCVEGHESSENMIGIKLGSVINENDRIVRSMLRDIRVSHCAKGIEHRGWINRYERVAVEFCDVGVELALQNASSFDLMLEGNGMDFNLMNSSVVRISNLLMEGNDYHTKPSTIDNVHALTIGTLYIESGGTALPPPWLHIGPGVNPSHNVIIENGHISGNQVPDGAIILDNVQGIKASVMKRHTEAKIFDLRSRLQDVELHERQG